MGSSRFWFQYGKYLPEFLGAFGNEAQCDSLIGGRARDGRFRYRAATGWHTVMIGPGNPYPSSTDVLKMEQQRQRASSESLRFSCE